MTLMTTPQGRRRLETSLAELEQRVALLVREKAETAETGGNQWHDNFSFEQLERDERALRHRIAALRDRLDRAVDVTPAADDQTVGIGTTVDIELDGADRRTVTIVGHGESDPAHGKVTYDAPLGQAILDAHAGERRTMRVAGKSRTVAVLGLRPER